MNNIDQVKTIAVAGAGTMGSGIAQLSAQAGYQTVLYDLSEDMVQKGLASIRENLKIAVTKKKISVTESESILQRIHTSVHVDELVAEVVIEAIIERLDIKTTFFKQLATINNKESIFCSNTSSIPITLLAKEIPYPERIAGMHFFNPAHLMKLVEVVSGEQTSSDCAQTVYDLAVKMGKQPVMTKDRPGFIVNRIGKMYHTESLKLLEEGIAPVATIDQLMEAGGFKMGPFRLIDLIGVDANLNVTKSLYELMGREERFQPSVIQQQMVDAGMLGRKSGQGFYKYNE